MPDGPPVRFRWRRALHEVAAFEGPERIAAALVAARGRADPRLFPRRGYCRPPLLALPRRPLGPRDGAGRDGSCTGCSGDAPRASPVTGEVGNPFSRSTGEGGASGRRDERRSSDGRWRRMRAVGIAMPCAATPLSAKSALADARAPTDAERQLGSPCGRRMQPLKFAVGAVAARSSTFSGSLIGSVVEADGAQQAESLATSPSDGWHCRATRPDPDHAPQNNPI